MPDAKNLIADGNFNLSDAALVDAVHGRMVLPALLYIQSSRRALARKKTRLEHTLPAVLAD